MADAKIKLAMDLPEGYDTQAVLVFHGRDKEDIAETVTETSLTKGIVLGGAPAAFHVKFSAEKRRANCTVDVDGAVTDAMRAKAREVAKSLLGLRIDPMAFAMAVAKDPVFGPLTARQAGLRIVQVASIYEALTWAILGQQINVSFAVALRRTFIQLAGRRHSSGLWCYPTPDDAARVPLDELTSRKFSRAKAETVLRLSTLLANGELDLLESQGNPIEAITQALLGVKGIGPWTVNYALLRGYGHTDSSLHGDVAVRSAIARLWGHAQRPAVGETEAFLEQYAPHRTMAAAHLWASLNAPSAF
ncbi:MAG: DNA-3-methyladenine glycosylase 2 [Aquabacterium sp.]